MANDSLGPIQIFEATPSAINDALRQLVDRIDELRGLRGEQTIFGQTTFSGVAVRVLDSGGHLVHAFGATT